MKAMISQPMRGKTNNEIREERKLVVETLKQIGFEVIDTVFNLEIDNPIYYLSKSIEALSEADIIVFLNGWENARGCKIEFEIANAYGKQIIILSDKNK